MTKPMSEILQEFRAMTERLKAADEALVCRGEDAGVEECEAAEAWKTCERWESRGFCPRKRRAELAAEEAERKESRRRTAELCGVPTRCLDRLEALGETAAVKAARAFIASPDWALILAGEKGCGKTTAAAWAAWTVPGARFVDVSKLVRANKFSEEQMAELEECRLLVVDDLGTEYADAKGAFGSLLDGLLNARYANERKTIVTTNLDADVFRKRYGERIYDRLREGGRFLEIAESSMRGVK